jgi:hypothetical protein
MAERVFDVTFFEKQIGEVGVSVKKIRLELESATI